MTESELALPSERSCHVIGTTSSDVIPDSLEPRGCCRHGNNTSTVLELER